MKKSLLTLAITAMFATGLAFAADAKTEAKVATCCANATKAGNACTHSCCVEAAKAGKNCEKCGGSGALAKKEEPKK